MFKNEEVGLGCLVILLPMLMGCLFYGSLATLIILLIKWLLF